MQQFAGLQPARQPGCFDGVAKGFVIFNARVFSA